MEAKKQVTIALSLSVALLIGVTIGVLLIIIGFETEKSGVIDAGLIIAPLSLFAGAFLLKEENNIVRLGMLIAAGLILAFGAQWYAFQVV